MLLLHNVQPLHWAVAGVAIAAITLAMQALKNTSLGISTSFENLCGIFSSAPLFRRKQVAGPEGQWRLPFMAGLLLAGMASAVLAGGWQLTWNMGMFDEQISSSPLLKTAWLFVGGLFIGFGTRMAGGCTSGHGIFGMANLEKSSMVATLTFMGVGTLLTNIIYRVIF